MKTMLAASLFRLVAYAEVAADGEGLGLLFYSGLLLDLHLTCASLLARRAVSLPLAVGAGVAVRAVVFQSAARAGLALRAGVLIPAVGIRVTLPARAFHLAM